ncbi:hypothetical protein [Phascolarctobacterium succinatutens]|uniref:RNA polymerase sigma factor n=1 Tax=Phascolarctobacterium succinatutens TaxID=626940 RepID=UPI003076C1E5
MQYNTEFCYTRSTNRHRKELAKITNQPNKIHNAERYTPKELKELILAAQAADEKAIESLCETFKPLILKESHYPSIFDILGEDAVNTAWLIFLEQIKKYDGRDFGHLPGLLQYHVHYGLLHKFTRGKSVKDCYYLDAEEEGEETQIADKKNDIDELMHNQLLSDTMRKLTKEQFTAVNELVLQDVDYKIFCNKHKCSVKTAYKHRANGLKKLKAIIA